MDVPSVVSAACAASSLGVVIFSVTYGTLKYIDDKRNRERKKREEEMANFEKVVSGLSSAVYAEQLSSAVLLRRYYTSPFADLKKATTNVIASLLRTFPTGVLQKSLGDGLAYADTLEYADLQNTNLQNVYLGIKIGKNLNMQKADLYLSDLSYALLEHVDAQGAYFSKSSLIQTTIKNSNLTGAQFKNCNFSQVTFEEVDLKNANFSGAYGLPREIVSRLDENGCYVGDSKVSFKAKVSGVKIFFSTPSCMSREDDLLVKEYKRVLEKKGHEVVLYSRDDYPNFGQFNKIRNSVNGSRAMVTFGFKQTRISEGVFRPGTPQEMQLKDEWLPTDWNNVETGMGVMKGLPILLVHDKSVKNGIFDAKLSEIFVASILTETGVGKIENHPAFIKWLSVLANPTNPTAPQQSMQ